MKLTAAIFLILILTTQVQAKVLQEGWFQILLGQQHIGYMVQRYTFDESKKQFKYVGYLKTNALGGNVNQSTVETCEAGFAPISYQYTAQVDKKVSIIDAVFKGKSLTAKITEDGQTRTVQDKIKDGVFFEDFLIYIILNNKAGLKVGNTFSYNAIDNETTKTEKGFADIKEMESVNGHETFRIANTFKDGSEAKELYISHVSPIGEIYDIRRPDTGVQVIATKREEATKGFTAPEKLLKSLFGSIPKDSALAIATTTEKKTAEPTKNIAPAKQGAPEENQ